MPVKPYEQDYTELLEESLPAKVATIKQMRVGASKADLIAIDFNCDAIAFEIKTERDNLRRLQAQLSDYQKVFLKVIVFTYEKQALKLADTLPKHIGVATIGNNSKILFVRKPKDHLDNLRQVAIFDALNTKLALEVLKTFKIQIPELPNTQMRTALLGIFESLDAIKLQKVAMDVLYRHHIAKTGKGQVI